MGTRVEKASPRRTFWRMHWPAVAVGLYFLAWTVTGLRKHFSYDDVTNLYGAWVAPLGGMFREILTVWSSQSRPVGGLVYRGLYAVFDFHPLPFRLACLGLVLLNLGLQYRLYAAISGSLGIAWAALLFGCFHGAMWEIYTHTGVVYDILCATFYYAALLVYVKWRRAGCFNAPRAAAILLLTLLALGSKEMALSLPVALLLYEVLFHPPESYRHPGAWAAGIVARAGPSALACLAFVAGRLWVPGPLTGHLWYTPVFTLGRFLETTTSYTALLFDSETSFTPAATLVFWAGCAAIALLARSRLMVFGLVSFMAGMLPLSFVYPRHRGYVFYVPMFGLALYVAAAFWALRERLSALAKGQPARARIAAALGATFVCGVVWTHYREGAWRIQRQVMAGGEGVVRTTAERLPRVCPRLSDGNRVLLVNSPFDDEPWVADFTLGLLYHARDVHVVNVRTAQDKRALADHFDYMFAYRDKDFFPLKPAAHQSVLDALAPPAYLARNSSLGYRSIVKEVGDLEGDGWRWVGQDPELRFTAPAGATTFSMELWIPDVTVKQTGPARVSVWVDDQSLGTQVFPQAGYRKISFRLPGPIPAGKIVHARMHVHNPYIAKEDQARLGFMLISCGLE